MQVHERTYPNWDFFMDVCMYSCTCVAERVHLEKGESSDGPDETEIEQHRIHAPSANLQLNKWLPYIPHKRPTQSLQWQPVCVYAVVFLRRLGSWVKVANFTNLASFVAVFRQLRTSKLADGRSQPCPLDATASRARPNGVCFP